MGVATGLMLECFLFNYYIYLKFSGSNEENYMKIYMNILFDLQQSILIISGTSSPTKYKTFA